MTKSNKFYMAGTEGTGRYLVVLCTGLGRVGYRDLGAGTFRIRIEPPTREAGDKLRSSFPGYKEGTGGKEYRFSTVISGGQERLRAVIANAVKALTPGGQLEVNPEAPEWVTQLLADAGPGTTEPQATTKPALAAPVEDHASLVARAKELGIKGVSSRWTEATLRRKIAETKPAPTTAEQEATSGETEAEERDRLLSAVRQRKLPGANLAARWSLETLRAKAAAL